MTRSITSGLLLGGALLVVAAAIKTGEHMHLISSDTGVRAGQCAIGLSLAFYANYIPKAVSAGRMQVALRVSGWCFMLAGLAYAALFVFAPLAIGSDVAIAAVAAATIVTIVLAVWACTRLRQTAQVMPPEA